MSLISRREALAPIAVAFTAPAAPAVARTVNVKTYPTPLPERYDEALGIGLEGWAYPAPIRWHPCIAGGQMVRMAFMDIAPTGKSRNKTIVLLHGKNFDSSYWAAQIKDLSEAGFRVIVPDQIGFNKSSKPDVEYAFEMLADLTINLLSGLQISQATFLGHSTGGMLAVRIATAYPDHVDRLILEDPIGLVDYRRYITPQSTDALIEDERRRTVTSYRAFMRNYFPVLSPQAMEPFVEWRMRVAQSSEYERFCRATARTYQMIYREPVRDQFPDIRAMTLMIVGDKDKSAPLKQYASPEMAAKMPSIPMAAPDAVRDLRKGTLVVVPGVGHVPHLEAPDAFRSAVMGFLSA